MNEKLIEQLQSGVCMHKKRWSGDVHSDEAFGPLDEQATNALMSRAADEIKRLRATVAELRHQADCYWYGLAEGKWALSHCEECRRLWEAVAATGETANQREGGET